MLFFCERFLFTGKVQVWSYFRGEISKNKTHFLRNFYIVEDTIQAEVAKSGGAAGPAPTGGDADMPAGTFLF